jgi:hypothetical protein
MSEELKKEAETHKSTEGASQLQKKDQIFTK